MRTLQPWKSLKLSLKARFNLENSCKMKTLHFENKDKPFLWEKNMSCLKMWKRLLLFLLAILIMTGCAFGTKAADKSQSKSDTPKSSVTVIKETEGASPKSAEGKLMTVKLNSGYDTQDFLSLTTATLDLFPLTTLYLIPTDFWPCPLTFLCLTLTVSF